MNPPSEPVTTEDMQKYCSYVQEIIVAPLLRRNAAPRISNVRNKLELTPDFLQEAHYSIQKIEFIMIQRVYISSFLTWMFEEVLGVDVFGS